MEFNEKLFVYSLTTRPVDAKRFSILFKPEWLSTAEYIPILSEIFEFTKAHSEPPSIETLKKVFGKDLLSQMKKEGIYVKTVSFAGLAEEAGFAYKDIHEVVEALHLSGISLPVVSFKPIGNIKG